MSKISLKPNASGTGIFSLEAPNSNTDRTLTLPDEAGSVLTDVSDIETQVKTATNATGSAPVYACRAWVNFDGTGTVSIRQSGNVSSITDDSTGVYFVNFLTSMPDNNYAITSRAADVVSTPNQQFIIHAVIVTNSSTLKYETRLVDNDNNTMSLADSDECFVAIFR